MIKIVTKWWKQTANVKENILKISRMKHQPNWMQQQWWQTIHLNVMWFGRRRDQVSRYYNSKFQRWRRRCRANLEKSGSAKGEENERNEWKRYLNKHSENVCILWHLFCARFEGNFYVVSQCWCCCTTTTYIKLEVWT